MNNEIKKVLNDESNNTTSIVVRINFYCIVVSNSYNAWSFEMTYHKFWKGLNRHPFDPRRRWNDSYILAKEWYEYFIGLVVIPIVAAPILPLYLLLQLPSLMLSDKSGLGVSILLGSLVAWYVLGTWKVLPYFLKKYNIIIFDPKYNVKQPFRREVES